MSNNTGFLENFGGMISIGIAGLLVAGTVVVFNKEAIVKAVDSVKNPVTLFLEFGKQSESKKPVKEVSSSKLQSWEDVKPSVK